MSQLHEQLGSELAGFGGFLECLSCGHRQQLGNISNKLANGWPKHCGYTMRWWTQRQVDAGEHLRAR